MNTLLKFLTLFTVAMGLLSVSSMANASRQTESQKSSDAYMKRMDSYNKQAEANRRR